MPRIIPTPDTTVDINATKFYTTFAEWEKNPPAEPEWLVENIITEGGVSLWAAKPKTGKSIIGRQLTWSIASGRNFLHRMVNNPGPALYVGMEDDYGYVIAHFRKMGARSDEEQLAIAGAMADSPEGRLEQLEQAIKEHDIRFVFIDPFARFLAVQDTTGAGYGELTAKSQFIIDLARKYSVHIAGSWHHTKGEFRPESGTDAVFGNIQAVGFVDTVIQMWGDTNTSDRQLKLTQRYAAPMEPWSLKLDDQSLTFKFQGSVRDKRGQDIIDTCKDGEWYPSSAFESISGLRHDDTRNDLLAKLVRDGKLEQESRKGKNNKLGLHYRKTGLGTIISIA